MSLVIGFSALKVHCSIGIHPHEKKQQQDIFISLKVRPSNHSEMIDYSALAELCTAHARQQHYDLIESLALVLVDAIFSRFPCVHAWIRIEKPAAIPLALCAFVEYEKER
jgi:dihydroneopterin aldolase